MSEIGFLDGFLFGFPLPFLLAQQTQSDANQRHQNWGAGKYAERAGATPHRAPSGFGGRSRPLFMRSRVRTRPRILPAVGLEDPR